MPRGDRGMGREDRTGAGLVAGLFERDPVFLRQVSCIFEGGKGAVSFIEMDDPRHNPEMEQQLHAADPQDHLMY